MNIDLTVLPVTKHSQKPAAPRGNKFLKNINPFRIGDVVQHLSSKQGGFVTEVRGDQVKFWNPSVQMPDGQKKILRFHYSKLKLLMSRDLAIKTATEIEAKERQALAPKPGLFTRMAIKVKEAFKPNTPVQPEPEGV